MDPSNNLQAQKSPLGVKEPDQGQLYEAFEFAPDNKPIKSLEVLNFSRFVFEDWTLNDEECFSLLRGQSSQINLLKILYSIKQYQNACI